MKKEDPRFSRDRLEQLANDIEEYLDVYKHVWILPEPKDSRMEKKLKTYMGIVEELIVKLRKGKISVFKDPEEVENIDWIHQLY